MAAGLRAAEPIEAQIVDLASDGRGVARVGGKTVFVAGALPGEIVRLRVHKRRRMFDEAAVTEILSPSPLRVVPRCRHVDVCGGCSLQHLSAEGQLQAKQRQVLQCLERIGRATPEQVLEPLGGPAFGYRRRARLGVRYVHKKGRVLVGFRERQKPYVADLERCEILIERLAALPSELAALIQDLSIREQLPQVEVAAGDAAAALVFRVLESPSATDLERLRDFGRRHSLSIYLQRGGPDSVEPLETDTPPLSYAIDEGAVSLEFAPAHFIQVNRQVNAAMVDAVVGLLDPRPGDRVLELFCGLGNFTLPLARRAQVVTGVEGDRALVDQARANAERNAITNVGFHVDNLYEPGRLGGWAAAEYDLVLLDPPRAGALAIMERAAQWRPRRVVYISCHPGSLARDAGILLDGKGFRLVRAGVMDMFPHTTHVESIAVFERSA